LKLAKEGVDLKIKTMGHLLILWAIVFAASAQTAPPPPTPVEPAIGASLMQPITFARNPIVDPNGAMGSYTWQVETSSTFSTVITQGFQNMVSEDMPAATLDQLSGLPNVVTL